MIEKILKIVSIIVLVAAVGVFAYIIPNVQKDMQGTASVAKEKVATVTKENKYKIITNPNASDIVFMTTMLAGTVVVSAGSVVAFKEYEAAC